MERNKQNYSDNYILSVIDSYMSSCKFNENNQLKRECILYIF